MKVEAAGIEPGQFDDLGAISPGHLAQVRDPPREMRGPRALSRVGNRDSAGSVDQRDHSGLAQRSQPRSMVPTSCSCSGPTAAHVAVAVCFASSTSKADTPYKLLKAQVRPQGIEARPE